MRVKLVIINVFGMLDWEGVGSMLGGFWRVEDCVFVSCGLGVAVKGVFNL